MAEIVTAREQTEGLLKSQRNRLAAVAAMHMIQGDLSALAEAGWHPCAKN